MKLQFCAQVVKKYQILNFLKIRPVGGGGQFFHGDGLTGVPERQPTHKSLDALYSTRRTHSSTYLPQILPVIQQVTKNCASCEKKPPTLTPPLKCGYFRYVHLRESNFLFVLNKYLKYASTVF